ncbi:MAG: DNA gyrase C-terminal beta-propeller domain-containing protein, partial [Nanoarchaeota archaeon]
NINVTEKNGKVVGIKTVKDYDEIMCITDKGQIIRTEVNNISRVGRNSQGVRLIRLKENDKVASVSRVVKNS